MPATIRFGSRGTDVQTAQQQLNQKLTPSPQLAVDGVFGNCTDRAVRDFQRRKGLTVDGIVGPMTWAELLKANNGGGGGGGSQQPPVNTTPPTSNGNYTLIAMPRGVPHFCQGDARWGSVKLNKSLSIKSAGCCLSSIAMVLNAYGRTVDPLVLDQYLDSNSGYSGEGLIWDVAFKCKQEEARAGLAPIQTHQYTELKSTVTSRIGMNMPTLCHVDYHGSASGDHWVVAVGLTSDGNIIMNDPGSSSGNGYADPTNANNVLETCSKGYKLVRVCTFQ